MIDANDINER